MSRDLERFIDNSLSYLANCVHHHVVFKTFDNAVIKRKAVIDKYRDIDYSLIKYPMVDGTVANIIFSDGYYYTVAACIRKMTETQKGEKYKLEPNFKTMNFLPEEKEHPLNQNLEKIKTFTDKKLFHNEKIDEETKQKVSESAREFSNITEKILFQLIKILNGKYKTGQDRVGYNLVSPEITHFIKYSLLNKNTADVFIKLYSSDTYQKECFDKYEKDCSLFEWEVNTFCEDLARRFDYTTTTLI